MRCIVQDFVFDSGRSSVSHRPEEAFAHGMQRRPEPGRREDATFALGRCYKNGIGTEENPDKALEWFTKGAENNEPIVLQKWGWLMNTVVG